MNALSLFDGMGCLYIALIEAGVKVDKYYSSEVDKYANAQTKLNIPGIIQLGDVRNVDVSQLDRIDFIGGGSPCQSFSFAGKRKGMSTKCEIQINKLEQYLELKEQGFEFEGQSYLFWEYIRILTEIRKYNPDVKFLLENVEMGAKWERILSEAIGVYGVHINSNLVSAQNRARIYWTNIKVKEVGLFGELHSDIPQPKDRGILLKDILESEVDEKYFISQNVLNRMERKTYSSPQFDPDKTGTLNTKNNSGQMALDSGTTFISVVNDWGIFRETERSTCLDANYFKGMDNHAQRTMIVAMRGHNPENPSDRRTGSPTEQRLEPNTTGKTNCLTSVQKDNLVMIQRGHGFNDGGEVAKDGKTPPLTKSSWEQNNLLMTSEPYPEHRKIKDGESGNEYWERINREDKELGYVPRTMNVPITMTKANTLTPDAYLARGERNRDENGKAVLTSMCDRRIRRLTPTECARLQTIPDWYKWECSDTQIYRMCGNGWTVQVIVWILSFLKQSSNQ